MKSLRRLILLYLIFTVEVQIVSALETKYQKALPAKDNWLSEPANCHPGDANCSLLVKSSKLTLTWKGQPIVANSKSALWWQADTTLRLIDGTISARLVEGQTISFTGGEVFGKGLSLIQRQGQSTLVTVLEGEMKVRPFGSSQDLILPAGYSVTLGAMTKEGSAQVEIPQAASPTPTLKRWWSVYDGSKPEFMRDARRFMKNASTRAQLASDWHQQMVQRAIASQLEKERQLQKRREIEEQERAQMRALFRKMNYLTD